MDPAVHELIPVAECCSQSCYAQFCLVGVYIPHGESLLGIFKAGGHGREGLIGLL